jgi:phosphoribosylformylglycinamidine cyclo-ligase
MAEKSAYARAGVNIAAGQRATELMKAAVRSTFGPEVLSDVGAFGGLYDIVGLKDKDRPILVASTDGVGTKTQVAARINRWDTIGYDIVNHCVNDILVQGAEPLFFLDYVASARLEPEQISTVVRGIAAACRRLGCALLGGETAEMPGVYYSGALDLVGTVVGVVERDHLIDGRDIRPGDAVVGLPATGLHTNGYTLARAVLDDLDWAVPLPELDELTVAELLLAPHRAYLEPIRRLWQAGVQINGLCHITGGGLVDNPPRIFPTGVGAQLWRGSWPVPPIFGLIQQLGRVSEAEMFHVFNMGLGMLVVLAQEQVVRVEELLGENSYVVGEIVAGPATVVIR